jgi:hypothetical protein
MGESYKDTKDTRHIMRRNHCIRECIASNQFTLFQLADIGNNSGPRQAPLIQIKNPLSRIQEG